MWLQVWMVLRYLRNDRRGRMTLGFSVLGMSFGVAALVLSMAIVSGYESTLKKSVIDSFGHLVILRKGAGFRAPQEFETELKAAVTNIESMTPFLLLEAILAHNKELGGVVVEGIDLTTYSKVIDLKKHIIDGDFELGARDQIPLAIVGKGIQKKFRLKIGDQFRVVLPMSAQTGGSQFRSRLQKFILAGVVDLGRHDFDERYVLTDINAAQKFADVGERVSGFRIRLDSSDAAEAAKLTVEEKFGYPYIARSWFDSNKNIFLAAKYEKIVIFFIVLLMVVAASFNIASTLFVTVLRRYHDISILKAMGASRRFIYWMFAVQGLVIGVLGAIVGIGLGYGICEIFMWVQTKFPLFPAEIYRIDRVNIEIRGMDLVLIVICSMVICFLSSLMPAKRGADLYPVEGLRYE
jgi:lipoprotein-releasing system permease protein